MLLSSLLMLTFLLSDSGGPVTVDIYDVPIVPALMLTVSLHAVADYTTFAIIPAFAGVPTVLAVSCAFIPAVAFFSAVVC